MNKLKFRAAKAHQVRWKMIIVYLVVMKSHGCEFSEGSLPRELPAGPQSRNNVAATNTLPTRNIVHHDHIALRPTHMQIIANIKI